MPLIKLTSVSHPDFAEGKPQPVYIDWSRIICVCATRIAQPREGSKNERRIAYDNMYEAITGLAAKCNAVKVDVENIETVNWMRAVQATSAAVSDAYRQYSAVWKDSDNHPQADCTEVQLACGTALEHGVMLARVYVSETPEEVVAKIPTLGIHYMEPA